MKILKKINYTLIAAFGGVPKSLYDSAEGQVSRLTGVLWNCHTRRALLNKRLQASSDRLRHEVSLRRRLEAGLLRMHQIDDDNKNKLEDAEKEIARLRARIKANKRRGSVEWQEQAKDIEFLMALLDEAYSAPGHQVTVTGAVTHHLTSVSR